MRDILHWLPCPWQITYSVCALVLPSFPFNWYRSECSVQSLDWTEVQQSQMTSHGFVSPPGVGLFLAFVKDTFAKQRWGYGKKVHTSSHHLWINLRTVIQPGTSEATELDQWSGPYWPWCLERMLMSWPYSTLSLMNIQKTDCPFISIALLKPTVKKSMAIYILYQHWSLWWCFAGRLLREWRILFKFRGKFC